MAFARFMASFWGRALRVIAGLAVIWWGMGMSTVTGNIIAIVGVLLVLVGLFNVCLIGPLFGAPLRGKDIPPKGSAQSM